jgi:hypothetical protein
VQSKRSQRFSEADAVRQPLVCEEFPLRRCQFFADEILKWNFLKQYDVEERQLAALVCCAKKAVETREQPLYDCLVVGHFNSGVECVLQQQDEVFSFKLASVNRFHCHFFSNDQVVLMACINLQVERASDVEAESILALITEIRQDNRFRCPIVMMVECAPGIAASHVERVIEAAKLPDVCMMSERKGYLVGVPKTEQITYEYYVELERVLSTGLLEYSDQIVVHDPRSELSGSALVEQLKDRMGTMMKNLRKEYAKNRRLDGTRSFVITAKPNDDMFIALEMANFWRRKFWSLEKYKHWHDRIRGMSLMDFPF